jgi:hypothetical protein
MIVVVVVIGIGVIGIGVIGIGVIGMIGVIGIGAIGLGVIGVIGIGVIGVIGIGVIGVIGIGVIRLTAPFHWPNGMQRRWSLNSLLSDLLNFMTGSTFADLVLVSALAKFSPWISLTRCL